MDNEQQEFERNLEKLISLFRKLRDRGEMPGEFEGMDQNMRQSMDFLIQNFEMMKKDPSAGEALKNIGIPFKQMIAGLVKNLSEQLGEDSDALDEVKKTAFPEPVVKEATQVEVGAFTRRLVQIDSILSKGNLPEEDIDTLLDERIRILEKLNSGK
ncbi:MAG: hypothetical protein CVU06_01305 [Bacteroidetes bacterium HGW-Bacteroidetes-22]|nr:MAG: hypothetical protein CVU06_01305 [Bacteroidetes bacterium HGW-Bacteroidetes-22]